MLMSKVNIHYGNNDDYKDLKGILIGNVITFYDSDFKISFDFEDLVLKKDGVYGLILNFKDCIFCYKSCSMSFEIPILVKEKKILDNSFEVFYKLEDEVINFYIDYEVI